MWASASQWLVILLVVLILFGSDRVPKLAENLGKSLKLFKKGLKDEGDSKAARKDKEDEKP